MEEVSETGLCLGRDEMSKKRYAMLDILRGLTLISMIAYHTTWDMAYLFDIKGNWAWFESARAYVWQQSICWSFILLSGFCWSLGRKKWKRGLLVLAAGALTSGVTLWLMPDDRIIFGVLTFLGSAMLLLIPLDKLLCKCESVSGLAVSAILFFLTRNINDGELGFGNIHLIDLPEGLYHGWFATYLGFTERGFFSTDYFSLLPWWFLFLVGYFLYGVFRKKNWFGILEKGKCKPLEMLGKHSLLIYMVHQPLVYGVLWVVTRDTPY